MQTVAAIVLSAIILFYLRMAVLALNTVQHYYTAFTLVLATGAVCILILGEHGELTLR